MGNSIVLMKKECILLNKSNQLKNSDEYKFIVPFLENEKKYTVKAMRENGMLQQEIDYFLENKGHIMSLTAKEWHPRLNKPFIQKDGKCQFCGTNLSGRFYLTNQHNNNEIYVGNTCITLFSSDSQDAYQSSIKNFKQLQNNELLKQEYPQLKIEYEDNDFLDNQETIVLREHELEYINAKKKYRKTYQSLIKNITEKRIQRIEEIYSELEEIKKQIIESCNSISKKEFAVTKDLYSYLRKNKKFDYTIEIAKETGTLASHTIESIKFIPFLQSFENKFNKMYEDDMVLTLHDEDFFRFKMLFEPKDIILRLRTEIILEFFGRTIIDEKNNDFYTKRQLFVGKIGSLREIINYKELSEYFLSESKLTKIDKTALYNKNTKYNDYVYNDFSSKSIYQLKGKNEVYIIQDLEIIKNAIIFIIENNYVASSDAGQIQNINHLKYDSIGDIKKVTMNNYAVRKSFS